MQAGNEAAAVNLAAAGCPVAEPDYIGAGLAKASGKSELLGIKRERHKSGLAVAIIAHENCESSARCQDTGTIPNERGVAFKECGQRRRAGQVP